MIQISPAWAGEIQEIITSDPPGADIYWGKTKDKLENTGLKTPNTRSINAVEPWCYQTKMEGYSDSKIICIPDEYSNRLVNFKLNPSSVPFKKHTWEIGPVISQFTYEEPGLMKSKGVFYGNKVSYIYRNQEQLTIKAEAMISQGSVDYESQGTGSMQNIDDNMFEHRGLFGYEFRDSKGGTITPLIGLGYRYLNDDSSGRVTSTGHHGYKRESNYYYIPVGIEIVNKISNEWSVGEILEYDFFLKGRQVSYLSDVDPGFNDPVNDQKSGYGYRVSLKFQHSGQRIGFIIEPFFIFWKIDESEWELLKYNGSPIGYGYEPANESREIGISFKVRF